MESEADGEGAMRAADEGAGAAAVAVGAAYGGQGDPGDPVDPRDPGNPGVAGEAGGAAGGLVQLQWAAHEAGPRRDTAPGAGGPGPQMLVFTLTVRFPSQMQAEIAHQFLSVYFLVPDAIQKEFSVEGRVLVIRLTAEDFGQLRASVIFCVDQISWVVDILKHLFTHIFV